MKKALAILSFLLLLPLTTHANIAVSWLATSTDPGYTQPAPVNGNNPFIKILSISTSTFSNGINLVNGCFSVGGVCVGGTGGTNFWTLVSNVLSNNSGNTLDFGPNGATNPVLQVDGSTGSQADGITIKGSTAGNGTGITAISSSGSSALVFNSKGAANLTNNVGSAGGLYIVQVGASNRLSIGNQSTTFTLGTNSSASTVRYSITGAADTNLTASTEAPEMYINLGQARQSATGALALQRDFRYTPGTHTFVGASALTDFEGFSIDGAPIAGNNNTTASDTALYIGGQNVVTGTGAVTSSYGLSLFANTGATNNYAAQFMGGNVGIGTSTPYAALSVFSTAASVPTAVFSGTNPLVQIGTSPPTYIYLVNDRLNVTDNRNDYSADNSYNLSSGACATADKTEANDLNSTALNFNDQGHTSSGFTGIGCVNNPFTGFGANSSYYFDPSGDMNYEVGLGDFKWFTGGYATGNIKMRLNQAGNLILTNLAGNAAGSFLAVNASGQIIATTSPSAGSGTVNTGLAGDNAYYASNGTAVSATSTIFIAPTSIVTIGANGTTNPALEVDDTAASAVTGLDIIAHASGGGTTLIPISSNANETLFLSSKANAPIQLQVGGIQRAQINSSGMASWQSNINYLFSTSVSGTAATTRFAYNGSADTGLTAGTNAMGWYINLGQIRQHATGALALQQDFRFSPSTHSFVGASTLTDAEGFSIDGAPIAGTNATISSSTGLYIGSNAVGAGVTTSYGLAVNTNTGATNNYAAEFLGGNVGIGTSTPGTLLSLGNVASFSTATSTFYSPGGVNILSTGISLTTGGVVGISSTSPYTSGLSISAASSTDPNLPIFNLTGLENATVNAVQFIIDQYGRPQYHGDTPTIVPGDCGTSASLIAPSNDVTGVIQTGTGVITDCLLTLAHPFPAGTAVHVFVTEQNTTAPGTIYSINGTANTSLSKIDIHETTGLGSSQIQYYIVTSK